MDSYSLNTAGESQNRYEEVYETKSRFVITKNRVILTFIENIAVRMLFIILN